jgi:hypothetical protein
MLIEELMTSRKYDEFSYSILLIQLYMSLHICYNIFFRLWNMQITESSLQLWLSTQIEGNLVGIHQFLLSFLMFLFVTSYGGICVTDALLIINLPEGPTAHFKLSKLVLRKDIKVLYSVPFIIVFYVFSNFFHVK